MAVTLAEYAKQAYNSGNKLLGNIADWFLMESNPAQLIPWSTEKELAIQILAMQTLPTVGWRMVNGTPSESTGKFQDKIEAKYIVGHYIDVDRVIVKAGASVGDVRQNQRRLSAKAMAFEFNDAFINGNPSTTPTTPTFKWIKDRVTDINAAGYTSQYIDGGSATTGKGMLYDTTERKYFLNKLTELIYAVSGHNPDALYMNKKMLLAFWSCLRDEQLLRQDKDMFGRVITKYGDTGVDLIDIGLKADQSTEIITNAETVSGGTDETSIYAVKYGAEEYFWGIQQEPMQVTDLGLVQSKPVYRDDVEWVVGLAVSNPRSLARLYGLVADNGAS